MVLNSSESVIYRIDYFVVCFIDIVCVLWCFCNNRLMDSIIIIIIVNLFYNNGVLIVFIIFFYVKKMVNVEWY